MNRVSQVVSDLKPSGIRDFFELVMGMDNVISLGVGEPDFTTPMHIRQSAIQSLEDGYTNYTSNRGMLELRETIAGHLEKQYGLNYDPETEILITTGVSEGMDLAMRGLINPGDEVIVPAPHYISYEPTARMAGATVNFIQTYPENNFKITASDLKSASVSKSKILCLNYPANPTGSTYTSQELDEIANVADDENLMVISDEIYGQLTFNRSHVPFATRANARDRTVFLNGFSKSHAMTGLRIGYAAGPEDVIRIMTKIHQYTMLSTPTTAQFAAIEALVNGERSVKSMRDEYQHRRDMLLHELRQMGLQCVEPNGTFYAFPSIESTGVNAEVFCRNLLKEEKVAAVPGTAFGDEYDNFIRISFATDRNKLREALERIENFVNKLELQESEVPGQL